MANTIHKECLDCPFKRTNEWQGKIVAKMIAVEAIENSGNIFACHMKHPDNNVFSNRNMVHNDCGGFNKMLENMQHPNKYPDIVNNFLETNPTKYDFVSWAKSENKTFKLFETNLQV